jgi:hypothetical protein
VGGSGRGPILKYYPGICLEGLRKTSKDIGQDSRCPGSDSNQASPEYMSEASPLEPNCSVSIR